MSVRYEPKKILAKMASKKNVERLVSDRLTVNRAALNSIAHVGILTKKELEFVALGVLKDYRERSLNLEDEGLTKAEARAEIIDDPRLLVQRVQNATLEKVSDTLAEKYSGEFYKWLKSTAVHPDPLHRKKWGKKYQLGKGEKPGDRKGCQCGMDILV